MHHVGDPADLIYSVEHYNSLRCVRHADGHRFPFLDSDGCQSSGAVVHFIYEILVSDLASHKIVSDVVGIISGNLSYLVVHRSLEIFKMCRHVSQILDPGSLHLGCLLCFFFLTE